MVQNASVALLFLLLAPSLAAPITNDQHARAEGLAERDPNWVGSAIGAVRGAVRNFVGPPSIRLAKDLERSLKSRPNMVKVAQNVFSPSNMAKARKFATDVFFREDAEEISQRDIEYEDVATREPSFEKIKGKKASTNSDSEELEGREDDDVFERYFDDYEIDELD